MFLAEEAKSADYAGCADSERLHGNSGATDLATASEIKLAAVDRVGTGRPPYVKPSWSAAPGHPFKMEVLKEGVSLGMEDVRNEGEDATVAVEKQWKRRKNNARVVDDGEPERETSHVKSTEKNRRLSEDGKDGQGKATLVGEEAPKDLGGSPRSEKEGEDNGNREGESKLEAVEEKQKENSVTGVNVDENSITEVLMRRADELKAKAESLTLGHVRRLLEEDLGLEPNTLDAHKAFIRNLVYELVDSPNGEAAKTSDEKDEAVNEGKPKKVVKGKIKRKAPSVDPDEHGDGDSTGRDSDGAKKQKVSKKKSTSGKRKVDKEVKKAPESKKPFGPEVERLRALCKTFELGIPPSAYAKANKAPEDERDEVLVKELENVLGRVGCPPIPSPNDIRRVKAQLKKKRDLDGIDNTNIVSEPRRNRASANSWFTPKPTNRYLQERKSDKTPDTEDSDEEGKPKVSGRMDD